MTLCIVLSDNTLFGTAISRWQGGRAGQTIFKVQTDGTGFTNLHSFISSSDGANPDNDLILSSNILYGAAILGGSSGNGTVFRINTDGTGFTNLHNFTGLSAPFFTNSDGALPDGGLVLSCNTLYGTTVAGGNFNGTVFKVNTDGTGFTNLHSFAATSANAAGSYTNSSGAGPYAGVILSGNTLYGTTYQGGSGGDGTVFALNTDGTSFTTLYSFTVASTNSSGVFTNSDGIGPYAGLILSGNTLYGTTTSGGIYGKPYGDVASGDGTVFGLTLPLPSPLTIIRSAANIILTWPTNNAGLTFTLQSTTNLVSSAGWNNVAPTLVVVSGQNTMTNPSTGSQQFYRLSE